MSGQSRPLPTLLNPPSSSSLAFFLYIFFLFFPCFSLIAQWCVAPLPSPHCNQESLGTASLLTRLCLFFHRLQDTQKARQFLPFLQRAGRSEAVVEYVFSGSRLKLYMPKDTCLITFLLAGKFKLLPFSPTQHHPPVFLVKRALTKTRHYKTKNIYIFINKT